jgi:hypothetical protein
MGYGGDPSASGIDAVRFWAQDTGSPELLSDAEVDYLITFSGLNPDLDPLDVAALAADRIAAKFAGEVSISADGVNYSGDQLYTKYQALAKELRQTARDLQGQKATPFVSGLGRGRQFALAMHDHPGAPTQPGPETSEDQLADLVDVDTGKVG